MGQRSEAELAANTDLPPGYVHRIPLRARMGHGSVPQWYFSSGLREGTPVPDGLPPAIHANTLQRVHNTGRLEHFYQCHLAIQELARFMDADNNISPDLLVEEVQRRILKSYQQGLKDGSGNSSK